MISYCLINLAVFKLSCNYFSSKVFNVAEKSFNVINTAKYFQGFAAGLRFHDEMIKSEQFPDAD